MLAELSFAEKINLVRRLRESLISFPAFRYKQLKDLLKLCADGSPDVVLRSAKALCDVFEDVLPQYRIRQYDEDENGSKAKEGKKEKISKEIEQLRQQEQSMLESYKDYLQVLEVFSGACEAGPIYSRLRLLAAESFCRLLKRHPHFNFRLNILQTIVGKLVAKDQMIRIECTACIKALL